MEINSNIIVTYKTKVLFNFFKSKVKTMKAIGCIRQIDKLGRLVLPMDIRKSLDIKDGVDFVEFFMDNDNIIIRKYRPACVFCNSSDDIVSYKNKNICKSCLNELKKNNI